MANCFHPGISAPLKEIPPRGILRQTGGNRRRKRMRLELTHFNMAALLWATVLIFLAAEVAEGKKGSSFANSVNRSNSESSSNNNDKTAAATIMIKKEQQQQ